MQRRASAVQHAYRASVYSSNLNSLFDDPHNSYNDFINSGNKKNLILSNATINHINKIINEFPNNKNIERIHIFNSTINESHIFGLISGIKSNSLSKLVALDLHNNKLSSQTLEKIFENKLSLTSLDLSFNNITNIPKFNKLLSAPSLSLYLDNNPSIHSIERLFLQLPNLSFCSLSGNKLSDDDIERICDAIYSTKHAISGLDLSYNSISDKGCNIICNNILQVEFSSLTQLSLQGNTFGNSGRLKLIKALESNPNILEFKPEYIYNEAELLRTDYPGKEQLTSWLQTLNLESNRSIFYKHKLSLDTLIIYDLNILSKELKPNDMDILSTAIDNLKNQLQDNLYMLTTIQYQSNIITGIELGDIISGGNFSNIYSGIWQKSIPVIVKQFKDSNIYPIKNEFNILCYLKHPNIINCYGRSYINSKDSLVFEKGIGDYLSWEPFNNPTDKQKVKFCIDICRALIYIKKKRIVHRDLSLRNIIIFEDKLSRYKAKLTDFGLSNFTKPTITVDPLVPSHSTVPPGAHIPLIEGSPEAMYQHSSQSDIWSFGILLWEMFESRIDHREVRRFLAGRIPVPTKCPEVIYSILCQCLVVDERRRIPVETVIQSLKQYYDNM